MFDNLTERLEGAFKRLRGKGKLTKSDVEEGLREIRMALLEADVAVEVARGFVDRIREQAVGEEILGSLTPGQQIVKVVHDELVALLGGEQHNLSTAEQPPTVILLVGLQGSGKTTAAAKLAKQIHSAGRTPLLAACDLQRPGAVEQLTQLGAQIGVPVEGGEAGGDPVKVAKAALKRARADNHSTLIVDSAGRLHIDQELMDQARDIKRAVDPHETLLVLDSMTGQDAVNAAAAFGEALEPTGAILTKLDGDSRGGAALSLREVTGVPILYAGVGEKVDDLEAFHPDRMASRILGMGDVMTLIERAEKVVEAEQAEAMERKLRDATFDLSDFLEQLQMVKKMGPVKGLLKMLPGNMLPEGAEIDEDGVDEDAIVRTEAIIQSMTPRERAKPELINASRRTRIAGGSGTKPQDVSGVVKQFQMMRKMLRRETAGAPGNRKKGRKARKALPKVRGF